MQAEQPPPLQPRVPAALGLELDDDLAKISTSLSSHLPNGPIYQVVRTWALGLERTWNTGGSKCSPMLLS